MAALGESDYTPETAASIFTNAGCCVGISFQSALNVGVCTFLSCSLKDIDSIFLNYLDSAIFYDSGDPEVVRCVPTGQ